MTVRALERFNKAATVALLAVLFLIPIGAAQETKERRFGVRDEAKLFSKEAITKAEETMTKVHDRYKKDVFVETLAEGPKQGDFAAWATERARKHQFKGVYVVITLAPRKLEVLADRQTRDKGEFTSKHCQDLADLMLRDLRAGKKDEALVEGTSFILDRFEKNAAAKSANNEAKASGRSALSLLP